MIISTILNEEYHIGDALLEEIRIININTINTSIIKYQALFYLVFVVYLIVSYFFIMYMEKSGKFIDLEKTLLKRKEKLKSKNEATANSLTL